jgi:hypothetical protein
MEIIALLLIGCLVQTTLFSQEDVSTGKYMKFNSGIPGGEMAYLVHLPDGYDSSGKDYPVIYDEWPIGLFICKRRTLSIYNSQQCLTIFLF